MTLKKNTSALLKASKEVMDLAAKRRNARKVSAADELAPAPKPDLGVPDMGVTVPPDLVNVVEEAKADKQDDLGIVVPPALADIVAEVVDPDVLEEEGEDLELDMIPFLPEDPQSVDEVLAANARWVVFAKGAPLAVVALKDQDNKEKIAAHFISASFADSVMKAAAKKGVKAALGEVRARYYVAKLDETRKVKQITAALTAKAEEATRQRLAAIKATFTKSLQMALQASANNFTVENPLKDDLIKRVNAVGVPAETAADMVDDAFFAKGVETINAILDQAEKWTNTPVEALDTIKAAVEAAGRRSRPAPLMASPAARNPNYNQQMANQFANNAVPVVSASVSMTAPIAASADDEPATPTEGFRARFGGFRAR